MSCTDRFEPGMTCLGGATPDWEKGSNLLPNKSAPDNWITKNTAEAGIFQIPEILNIDARILCAGSWATRWVMSLYDMPVVCSNNINTVPALHGLYLICLFLLCSYFSEVTTRICNDLTPPPVLCVIFVMLLKLSVNPVSSDAPHSEAFMPR